MPVRNVLRSGGTIVGSVPSRKLGRMIHYESLIERAYIYLLEYDPLVVSYEEQPCTIAYRTEGKERSYTPDFAVHWQDHQQSLVECKPTSKVDGPENALKWTAARLWCKQYGYTFALVTETALHEHEHDMLLSNIQTLAVHAHQRLTVQAKEYLLKTLYAEPSPLSVAEYVQRTPNLRPAVVRSCLWHLLYTGEIFTDLTKPLHPVTTLLSLP
jgi:hypothetical protein